MKRKVVVKVCSMNGQKCRSKALKIVVGVCGVESAAVKGEGKNEIEVIGEDIDAVAIVTSLRKKLGYAELVIVAPVKKKEIENTTVQQPQGCSSSTEPYRTSVPYYFVHELNDYDLTPACCSIM